MSALVPEVLSDDDPDLHPMAVLRRTTHTATMIINEPIRAALERFVDESAPIIARFLQETRDAPEVEDVLGQTALKGWRYLPARRRNAA